LYSFLRLSIAVAATTLTTSCAAPEQAPKVYVTENYALTFQVPPSLTYCPVPDNWVGADHGTVLFLAPPTECSGAGFPASSRSFAPADTPRIEVYYGYDTGEGDAPKQAEPCDNSLGEAQFMGQSRQLCRAMRGELTSVKATANYSASSPAEASFSLITTEKRLSKDLEIFRSLLASTHPCSVSWKDDKGGTDTFGTGPLCPRSKGWF
jgi:hypothetical protein